MPENDAPNPLPPAPAVAAVPMPHPGRTESPGCFRWGLIGCLFFAVLAVVGMILFVRKAPQLLDRLLTGPAERVLESTGPEVPAAAKDAYRKASERFVAGAKTGKVRPDAIRDVQRKTLESLRDGRVSAEELTDLTAELEAAAR